MSELNVDSSKISISGDYTTNDNVDESLKELFGSFNEANKLVKLNDTGEIDSSLRSPTTIDNHLVSGQTSDNSLIETAINRIDKYIEQMKVTEIFYSNNDYLLDEDDSRPIKKLSYIEYGEGLNDPLVVLIYSFGKLSRIDYYLDRSTYKSDGSGRNGFNRVTYNDLGKLESSVFMEL